MRNDTYIMTDSRDSQLSNLCFAILGQRPQPIPTEECEPSESSEGNPFKDIKVMAFIYNQNCEKSWAAIKPVLEKLKEANSSSEESGDNAGTLLIIGVNFIGDRKLPDNLSI